MSVHGPRQLFEFCPLLLLCVASTCVMAQVPAEAQSLQQLRQELKGTKADLEQTKNELKELRRLVEEMRGQPSSTSANPADATPYAATPARSEGDVTPQADDVKMIGSEIEQLQQIKVESASRYRVKLHGMVLFNAFGNSGTVDVTDVPGLAFANPGRNGDTGFSLRQTMLGAEIVGPDVFGAHSSASVEADFFGGFPTVDYGMTAGLVRLRTAGARLDWKNTNVFVGQDTPFISPLSPTSLANIAQPAFAWSGNLWVWTPQIRVEHYLATSDKSSFVLQGGLLAPLTENPPGFQNPPPDPAQASRQPAIAGRIAWQSGERNDPRYQFGVGGYFGRQLYSFNRDINAYALTLDWKAALGEYFSITGEFYHGQAVGGLGGSIWTSVLNPAAPAGTSIVAAHGAGGWAQLKFAPTARWEFNNGYGTDNNFSDRFRPLFVGFGPFMKNNSYMSNLIFKPRSNIRIAGEYRWIKTEFYAQPFADAHHFNIAAGVSF
jgi:hypothetical protein